MKPELIKAIKADCQTSMADYLELLEVLKNQSILITGGTGFMGKWLTEAILLLNKDHRFNIKLYLLARDIQDYKEEVPHLANQSFVNFIEQDVRNVSTIPDDIQWIIHAAGTPDNRKHLSNPLKTMDVFYKGTQAVLDACLRLPGLKKFVLISSNSIYGHQTNPLNDIREDQLGILDPNSVNSTYAESKRISETIGAIYRNQQKLPVVIVRPFAFIGPYQELDRPWAINNFIRDSILGGPIRILGNENTVRSYLYGSDMAFWLLITLANGKTGAIYNIGGKHSISLKALSEKITSNFSNKIEVLVKYSKKYPLNPSVSVPNTDSINRDLKVKQLIDFDLALKKTIDWYKELHQ